MTWRLTKPYLAYCFLYLIVTLSLLVWYIIKGISIHWNLRAWKHLRQVESLEVLLGISLVTETLVTMRLLGVRNFFRDWWLCFDFVVMLLTVVSTGYALEHVGHRDRVRDAYFPLLMLRFVLQPVRVLAVIGSTYRIRQMQSEVDELQIDFASLSRNGNANA